MQSKLEPDIDILIGFLENSGISIHHALRIVMMLLSSKSSVGDILKDISQLSKNMHIEDNGLDTVKMLKDQKEGVVYFSLLDELARTKSSKIQINSEVLEYIHHFKVKYTAPSFLKEKPKAKQTAPSKFKLAKTASPFITNDESCLYEGNLFKDSGISARTEEKVFIEEVMLPKKNYYFKSFNFKIRAGFSHGDIAIKMN
ncbi:MAG: Unknown protein [uncultured Sulfurovum sp.]|uniref:Uncharacterized protein n=1 Tax=uncultured Sulfurovum sp. TaxID=269237 RepID=A0A6S6SKY5_9BACT|nr:MAG: Unknown protein [uncultured Sulfurovum sp.]